MSLCHRGNKLVALQKGQEGSVHIGLVKVKVVNPWCVSCAGNE